MASKYSRYALWLISKYDAIDTYIRDQFSASGQADIVTINGLFEKMPATFGRIYANRDLIAETIINADPSTLLSIGKSMRFAKIVLSNGVVSLQTPLI